MGLPPEDFSQEFGRTIEDVVRIFCQRSFLSDFIVQSPKYKKTSALEKEAADIIVFFGKTLLVIQVKSKKVSDPITDTDIQRLSRAILKAQDQFRSMLEAFADENFGRFTNVRGEEFIFDPKEIKEVILIVVYATVNEQGMHTDREVQLTENCQPLEPIPLFVFSLRQFDFLLKLADTLPDFLLYLDCHYLLSSLGILPEKTCPQDVWALLAFEKERFLRILDEKVPVSLDGLLESHAASLAHLEKEEAAGYFIDDLIHKFHKTVGLVMPMNEQAAGVDQLESPGSIKAYHRMIYYFARLNRTDRSQLARELFIRVERSMKENRLSFGAIRFPHHDEAYLVMASSMSHVEMQIPAMNAAQMLTGKLNVRTVICLMTNTEQGPGSCSGILYTRKSDEVDPEVLEMYADFFSDPFEWDRTKDRPSRPSEEDTVREPPNGRLGC